MEYVDIEFDGTLGSTLGIYAAEYPVIPSAKERITEIEIPGRDGKLCEKSGKYESTELVVDFNYISKKEERNERWREAKKWLSASNARLRFGDDGKYYYKIKYVNVAGLEKSGNRIGKFSATFVTEDGLSYLEEGRMKKTISEAKNNPGILAHPIYYINGNGYCTLEVNGNKFEINVSENAVIDTELMISYKEDGKNQNTTATGDYEELYLLPGMNEITVTSGFDCTIAPNWRCL